eukprot:746948-Hanusia_phi.AAC.2
MFILLIGHGSRLVEDVVNILGISSRVNVVRDDSGEDLGYTRPTMIRGHFAVSGPISVLSPRAGEEGQTCILRATWTMPKWRSESVMPVSCHCSESEGRWCTFARNLLWDAAGPTDKVFTEAIRTINDELSARMFILGSYMSLADLSLFQATREAVMARTQGGL